MDNESDSQELTAFGLAALLPGMRRARKELDDRIRNYEQRLIDLQHASSNGHIRKGRPPKIINLAIEPKKNRSNVATGKQPANASWAKFDTPEKRSAEMARRMAKWNTNARKRLAEASRKNAIKARAAQKAQYVAAGKQVKSFWAKMTPEQRSAEVKRRRKVADAKKIAAAQAAQ